MQLILASGSPRRRQLIRLFGRPVVFCTADVDELSITTPDPAQNAIDTALLKATAVAPDYPDSIVVGADTNVAFGDLILGKPHDEDHAFDTLSMLRGRQHHVHTGLAVINTTTGQTETAVCTTVVQMRPYSDAEIGAYIATGDPMDKAGAYGIQHPVHQLVADLAGCYVNVVGLPVCALTAALAAVGLQIERDLETVCADHHHFAADIFGRMMAFAP